MPIGNVPYRDPEEDDPTRGRKVPKALARLRAGTTT